MKKILTGFSILLLSSGFIFAGGRKDSFSFENIEEKYPSDKFVWAMGQGSSLSNAESSAKMGLCQILGESISGQQNASQYSDSNGQSDSSLSVNVKEAVLFEHISGIQIKETWQIEKNTSDWRALAVLDRKEAGNYYARLAKDQDDKIRNLLMEAEFKDISFEALDLVNEAAHAARDNQYNLDLLHAINPAMYKSTYMSYGSLSAVELKKKKLASSISVSVSVANDYNGVVAGAIMNKLGDSGIAAVVKGETFFQIQGKIIIEDAGKLDGNNWFSRYTLEAPVVNTKSGKIEKSFSISGREGRQSQELARQRCYNKICQRIQEEF